MPIQLRALLGGLLIAGIALAVIVNYFQVSQTIFLLSILAFVVVVLLIVRACAPYLPNNVRQFALGSNIVRRNILLSAVCYVSAVLWTTIIAKAVPDSWGGVAVAVAPSCVLIVAGAFYFRKAFRRPP